MINRRGDNALLRGADRGACRSVEASSVAARVARAGEKLLNPSAHCRRVEDGPVPARRPDPVGARFGATGPSLAG